MKIVIVGTGAWAKAMLVIFNRNGHDVHLLHRSEVDWPCNLKEIDMVFVALPCQALRQRILQLSNPGCPVVSLMKGVEIESGEYVSQIFRQVWPGCEVGTLSGPTLAMEVQVNKPTAAVAAAESLDLARRIQELAHHKLFRVYTSSDLLGVELGGALKNIYAIAGGICKGVEVRR